MQGTATPSPGPWGSPPGHSPPRGEPQLPDGQCRFLLTKPDVKGHRCACVNFTRCLSTPNAICECGHMACYHVRDAEPSPSSPQEELSSLRERITQLEKTKNRDCAQGLNVGLSTVIARISLLEEHIERIRDESSQEIGGAYRNLAWAWHSVGDLENKGRMHGAHLSQVDARLARVDSEIYRMSQSQMELVDADLSLEERILSLEGLQKTQFTPNNFCLTSGVGPQACGSAGSKQTSPFLGHAHLKPGIESALLCSGTRRENIVGVDSACTVSASRSTWTVNVSILPSVLMSAPFEKDTTPYLRCLSRGLYQLVVVDGRREEHFISTVERVFSGIIQGRPWMPLRIGRDTNHPNLARKLIKFQQSDQEVVPERLDYDVLHRHYVVCGRYGDIETIYIALRQETLSWEFLISLPVHTDGLEASWEVDPELDGKCFYQNSGEIRPVAIQSTKFGEAQNDCRPDIVTDFPSLSPLKKTKRAVAAISGGFKSLDASIGRLIATDEDKDAERHKRQRTQRPCISTKVMGAQTQAAGYAD